MKVAFILTVLIIYLAINQFDCRPQLPKFMMESDCPEYTLTNRKYSKCWFKERGKKKLNIDIHLLFITKQVLNFMLNTFRQTR